MRSDHVPLGGAGPAGCAAAITLTKAGRRVLVHELQHEVGHGFGSDLQGLENWGAPQDVLDWLQEPGITREFTALPLIRSHMVNARDGCNGIAGKATLVYLMERGPGPGSLDASLLAQTRSLGTEVRFNSPVDRLDGAGTLAAGPEFLGTTDAAINIAPVAEIDGVTARLPTQLSAQS